MPRTTTRSHPTLTVAMIQPWRSLEDAPALRELAHERRALRDQRQMLLTREQEQLTALATAHKEKQGRLAQMGVDVSTYPAFDPATAKDPILDECRDMLLEVSDQLIQAEDAFEAEAEPVRDEYTALQKSRLAHLMDTALEALDVLEEVGEQGEKLCMQSWGCVGSYITNIRLFQSMMRRDRVVLQQERNRLAGEAEVFYG